MLLFGSKPAILPLSIQQDAVLQFVLAYLARNQQGNLGSE